MRVTQSMLTGNMLRNLSNSYERLGTYQDQLATNKKITRPSQDPVVAMKGMSYRTNLTEIEQYKRNFSEAYNWLESSDDALDKATSTLQRIRELTVQGSNGTYEENQKSAIATEIGQLKDQLISIANTQVAGKYIFNGNDTNNPPVTVDASGKITASTNQNEVKIELSKGIEIGVNINPTHVFSDGLFKDLDNLINDLNSTSPSKPIGDYLKDIDNRINAVLNERADLGARTNRIELMEDRIDGQVVIVNRILSDNEDADMEKVIMDLTTQESVLRAALGAGSRVIQPSLLDFLR